MARRQKPLAKCRFCGVTGRTKTKWRGSKNLDLFIWFTLFFPGPLYTLWRWSGRKEVCRYCESENFEILPPAELPAELKAQVEEESLGHETHRF